MEYGRILCVNEMRSSNSCVSVHKCECVFVFVCITLRLLRYLLHALHLARTTYIKRDISTFHELYTTVVYYTWDRHCCSFFCSLLRLQLNISVRLFWFRNTPNSFEFTFWTVRCHIPLEIESNIKHQHNSEHINWIENKMTNETNVLAVSSEYMHNKCEMDDLIELMEVNFFG